MLRFERFVLDTDSTTLTRDGSEVALHPKSAALLLHLIQQRKRFVPKQELLTALWPDVSVSETALASALRDLRRALGDSGAEPRFVATRRGRGYRFIHAVESVGRRALPHTAPHSVAPLSAAFVGRDDELRLIDERLDEAREGRGRAVMLVGEAGIGKTRILLEASQRTTQHGFDVHLGRCLEEAGAPAWWPWIQIVRDVVGARAADEIRAAYGAGVEAALRLDANSPPPTADDDAANARFVVLDAVTRLLVGAARERPRLLLLDDLHRADASSVHLLRHLLREVAAAPILVVGAYRGDEVALDHPLAALLAELHPAGERVEVPGLADEEAAHLVAALTDRTASEETIEAICARTAGNPLFIGEIARSLEAHGGLAADDAAARANALAPAGVRQVIRGRVTLLPESAAELLSAAAVLGRSFDLEVLHRMVGGDDLGDSGSALDAARRTGLIEPDAARAGAFRFAHILVRDALYEDLAPRRRAALHAAAARAIEALRAGNLDPYADELAHHFGAAAAYEGAREALHYARLAGEQCLARTAYTEAEQRFSAALRALELAESRGHEDARARCELLLLRGRARWCDGANEEARADFTDTARLARADHDAELLARAALGFAGRTDATFGVNREAVRLMEEALAALPREDSGIRSELLARLATEIYFDDEGERGQQLGAESLAIAERIGDDGLIADALSGYRYTLTRPGVDPARRLPLAKRLVHHARQSGARELEALGHLSRVHDLVEIGDAAQRDAAIQDLDDVSTALGQPFFLWYLASLRGMQALISGRIDEADRLAHEAFAMGQRFGTENALRMFGLQLFGVRGEQGRLGELLTIFEQESADQPDFPIFRVALMSAWVGLGRTRDVRDALDDFAAGPLQQMPRDNNFLPALAGLARCAAAIGHEDSARQIHALMLPSDGLLIAAGFGTACHGAVSHFLGLTSATYAAGEAAEEHFDAAVSQHRRAGAPLFLAHSRCEQGIALLKQGGPRDRGRARGLLRDAEAGYAAFGLDHQVERVQNALAG